MRNARPFFSARSSAEAARRSVAGIAKSVETAEPRVLLAAPTLERGGGLAVDVSLGERFTLADDADGDGTPDIVGWTAGETDTRVQVFSGRDLSVIAERVFPRSGDVGRFDDADGDGKEDLVFEGTTAGGDVISDVVSGRDLSTVRRVDPTVNFREQIEPLPGLPPMVADLNGDGLRDYIGERDGEVGVFSAGDDARLTTGVPDSVPNRFFTDRRYVGDADGDGFTDFIEYGNPAVFDAGVGRDGVFEIFSGVDGTLVKTLQTEPFFSTPGTDFDEYTLELAAVPDFDGDGADDLFLAGLVERYVVRVSQSDRTVLAVLEEEPDGPIDLNEDGQDDRVTLERVEILKVHSGADGSVLKAQIEPDHFLTAGFTDDFDGDGFPEIAVFGEFVAEDTDGLRYTFRDFDRSYVLNLKTSQGDLVREEDKWNADGFVPYLYDGQRERVTQQLTEREPPVRVRSVKTFPAFPRFDLRRPLSGSNRFQRDERVTSGELRRYYAANGAVLEEMGENAAIVADPLPELLSRPLEYEPGSPAMTFANGYTLQDDGLIASATLSISSGFVPGEGVLNLPEPFVPDPLSVSLDAQAGTLTISGEAPADVYQRAIDRVTYRNRAADPTPGDRRITVTVTDAESLTASAEFAVRVAGVVRPGVTMFTEDNRWVRLPAAGGESFGGPEELTRWPGRRPYDKVVLTDGGTLIGRNPANGYVFMSQILPDGTATERDYLFTLDTATRWSDILVGDFSPAGGLEAMVFNRDTGDWTRYEIGGGPENYMAVSRRAGGMSPNVDWEILEVGDFDGDGSDDVLSRVAGGSGHYVHSRDARDGVFRSDLWMKLDRRFDWEVEAVGNFDDRRGDDLLLQRKDLRRFYYALSDWAGGRFAVSSAGAIATSGDWSEAVAGDFDGDGRLDVAVRRLAGGRGPLVSGTWFIGTASGAAGSPGRLRFSAYGSWNNQREWVDVMAADFDGDGRDDLFGRVDGNDSVFVSRTLDEAFETGLWARILDGVDGPSAAVAPLRRS